MLALDFDMRLRATVTIHECKSVRGQSGEGDRLLWLAGLKQLLHADRAVLVRDTTSEPGRDLARSLGIGLLGAQDLRRREADVAWLPDAFAHVGASALAGLDRSVSSQMKAVGGYPPRLLSYLRYDALLAEPHRALGAVQTAAELAAEGVTLPSPAGRVIAGQLFMAMLLAAVRCAGRLDQLGPDALRRQLENGLAHGDPEDQRLAQVLELADALLYDQAQRLYALYVPSDKRVAPAPVPSLAKEMRQVPSWLPRFLDLCDRLRRRPDLARELPQTADLVLSDALHGGEAWRARAFDALFTIEHRQLLLVALDTLGLVSKSHAQHLRTLRDVPFDRVPPAVSERAAPPAIARARPPSPPSSPEGDDSARAFAKQLLAELVPALGTVSSAWLAVASVPRRRAPSEGFGIPEATEFARSWNRDARPIVGFDVNGHAQQAIGKVVLQDTEPPARYRLELRGDGSAVAAFRLDELEVAQGPSTLFPVGLSGQVGEDASVPLVIVRDRIETTALSLVELVLAHASARGVGGEVLLAARFLPVTGSHLLGVEPNLRPSTVLVDRIDDRRESVTQPPMETLPSRTPSPDLLALAWATANQPSGSQRVALLTAWSLTSPLLDALGYIGARALKAHGDLDVDAIGPLDRHVASLHAAHAPGTNQGTGDHQIEGQ